MQSGRVLPDDVPVITGRYGWALLLAIPAFIWPALYNGYPLVFADTGTYLDQALRGYAGWDRPPAYSVAILPLHLSLTTWPVIVVQALVTAHMLWLARRTLVPEAGFAGLVGVCALLSLGTIAPWIVGQLLPDLFTPLLVLALSLLALVPDRLGWSGRLWCMAIVTIAIAVHYSHLPLALGLLICLLLLRRLRRPATSLGIGGLARLCVPILLAVVGWISVNSAAHDRAALSPFGGVFLLARVIHDGPGLDYLRRACPAAGYRLCPYLDAIRGTSDTFLWDEDSAMNLAGGPKVVAEEAMTIVTAAVAEEPWRQARASLRNAFSQFRQYRSGDGLEPWPDDPGPLATLKAHFPPREAAAYLASRQSRDDLDLIHVLSPVHVAVETIAMVVCLVLAIILRRTPAGQFCAAVLLALVGNAILAGALSSVHPRYQARLIWLAVFAAWVGVEQWRIVRAGGRAAGAAGQD